MKHIIWTNDLDYNDWKYDLEADYPDLTESERISLMYEINDEYLEDERANMNKELYRPIVMIGSIERWDGRRAGIKFLKGTNLNDCLSGTCGDYIEWYVENHDIQCNDAHHDGTNHYIYRALRDITPDEFEEYAAEHSFVEAIEKYTEPLGHYVAEIYGFEE